MPKAKLVNIIEENLYMLDRMGDKLRTHQNMDPGYSRVQLTAILRLYLGGPARLKDIAAREGLTTQNLCLTFRKLETGGIVVRKIDESDRRNTWYSVSDIGRDLAIRTQESLRRGIGILFAEMTPSDAEKLTGAMQTMNEILKKMENKNV